MATANLVYLVVLGGALLHATWNAIVKGGPDKLLGMGGVALFGAIVAALTLPWLPALPQPAAWPWLAASTVLQMAYMLLVARIYTIADMSLTYPVMRGTAPMLVALASVLLFPEAMSLGIGLGIAVICAGILCMGWSSSRHETRRRGLLPAIVNAGVIAAYTIIDALGVRHSQAPVAYALCLFISQGIVMLLWLMPRRCELFPYLRRHAGTLLIGGAGTVGSYGAALWAMTLAPVAIVAALRETSILFGVLLATFVLREKPTLMRSIGALTLVVGVIGLRLLWHG